MTDHRRNIWMMMTDGIPDDALLAAAYKIVSENDTWPPTIGMLRTTALELATGKASQPTGLEAWEYVSKALENWDSNQNDLGPKTRRALKIVGGLHALKISQHTEGFNSDRTKFIEAFDMIIRREKEEREMLPLVRDFLRVKSERAENVPELNEAFLDQPRVQSQDEIESRRIQEMHDRKYGKQPRPVVLSEEEQEREISRLQAEWDITHD